MTRPCRVLIVEDTPSVALVMRTAIEQAGIDVDVAETTHEALARLRDHEYEAVVLDLLLPDGNGYVVMDTIRRFTRKPFVVVVTALDDEDIPDLDPALVQAFMRKPVKLKLLADVMQAACNFVAER